MRHPLFPPRLRAAIPVAIAVAGLACRQGAAAQAPTRLTDSAFVALVQQLSEPGGYFDTDNLISNEDSYLHPVTTLRRIGARGGIYVGVGPDQNFSYIAAVDPRVAFVVDIRRDNQLEHLLFKAIFALARDRADYAGLLFGRVLPDRAHQLDVDALMDLVARTPADPAAIATIRTRVLARIREVGLPLGDDDLRTISRFGRAPQPYYPDYRQLATATDRRGAKAGFLGSDSAFSVVKALEDRNLVIPVVGDFAGGRALNAIADWTKRHGERLTVFYTSNVEQYLAREGRMAPFVDAVARFPRDSATVMVRSCFVCRGTHPSGVDGYHAVQVVQRVDAFLGLTRGRSFVSYGDLVGVDLVPP